MASTSLTGATPASRTDTWVLFAIAFGLVGAALLLDPWAEANFDAPKRLAVLLAAAFGGLALCWGMIWPDSFRRWPAAGPARLSLMLLGGLLLMVLLATLLSPQPERSWPALRALALAALWLPLGASRALDGKGGRWMLALVLALSACNALFSILQNYGVSPLPATSQLGGRFPTGALLGNEGYVALASAFASLAALVLALNVSAQRLRLLALLCIGLCVLSIALNRQLTSALALGGGLLVVLLVHWRQLRLLAVGALLLAAIQVLVLLPSVRDGLVAALPEGGVAKLQQASTYRLGAWAATAEMIQARPFSGFGPGSFAADAQQFRLAAEIRHRERLEPPITASAFVYAHQEYLQLAAEAGVPALLLLLGALGSLLYGLARLARQQAEVLMLLGVISAGAIAALAWFPLQIPFTGMVLLLACGRGWRLLNRSGEAA